MSIKIFLEFKTHIDLDFFAFGIPVRLIRLMSDVQLKSNNGWSKEHKAIIDTGNPISVIPYSIWQNVDKKILLPSPTSLYGIGSTENSALTGRLAQQLLSLKMNIMSHPH